MKSRIVGLIFLAVWATSYATAAGLAELRISEITASPKNYVGKKVVVRGYLALGDPKNIFRGHAFFELKTIYDQEEQLYHSGREFDPTPYLKYCLTIANPERFYADVTRFDRKTIRLTGTIRPDQDVAPCGSGWALEVD